MQFYFVKKKVVGNFSNTKQKNYKIMFKPADKIQDLQFFGEFGGVNPSISDSSTYTFLSAKSMFDTFEGNTDGCYLYSRHSSRSEERRVGKEWNYAWRRRDQ